MFNVKTILLVTGLAGLTCQPQAWAITGKDDFDTPDIAASARLPISTKYELKDPQEKPPSVATQLQREQAENKKLKAQKAALRAKNRKLKAQLSTLQAAQSALAPAITPTISQTYKDPEHGLKKPKRKTKKKATKSKAEATSNTVRLKKKKRSHRHYSHKSDGLSLRSVLRN